MDFLRGAFDTLGIGAKTFIEVGDTLGIGAKTFIEVGVLLIIAVAIKFKMWPIAAITIVGGIVIYSLYTGYLDLRTSRADAGIRFIISPFIGYLYGLLCFWLLRGVYSWWGGHSWLGRRLYEGGLGWTLYGIGIAVAAFYGFLLAFEFNRYGYEPGLTPHLFGLMVITWLLGWTVKRGYERRWDRPWPRKPTDDGPDAA